MGKWCLQAGSFIFYQIFIKLAGNQDRHKISEEFEFRPDRISHFGVTCCWGRIKFSVDILWNLQVQLTFQTLEFFVTLLSGTVRPRRLKLGTRVDSGQMYHVYRNQAAAYSSLYFFIFLSLQFSTLKFFVTFLGNCAAAAYLSLYFFIFLSLQFSTLKFFITLFSGTVRPRRLKSGTHLDSGQMYHVYRNQTAAYSSPYLFIFLSLQFSTLKFFVTFLRSCEA